MDTFQEPNISELVKSFLIDRRDSDFTRVVKEHLGCSDQELLQAFLFTLTSSKTFANIILDGGEVTPSNAILMQTVEVQMAKLLEEQRTREKGSN